MSKINVVINVLVAIYLLLTMFDRCKILHSIIRLLRSVKGWKRRLIILVSSLMSFCEKTVRIKYLIVKDLTPVVLYLEIIPS